METLFTNQIMLNKKKNEDECKDSGCANMGIWFLSYLEEFKVINEPTKASNKLNISDVNDINIKNFEAFSIECKIKLSLDYKTVVLKNPQLFKHEIRYQIAKFFQIDASLIDIISHEQGSIWATFKTAVLGK